MRFSTSTPPPHLRVRGVAHVTIRRRPKLSAGEDLDLVLAARRNSVAVPRRNNLVRRAQRLGDCSLRPEVLE